MSDSDQLRDQEPLVLNSDRFPPSCKPTTVPLISPVGLGLQLDLDSRLGGGAVRGTVVG